jgi:hypothetical protein
VLEYRERPRAILLGLLLGEEPREATLEPFEHLLVRLEGDEELEAGVGDGADWGPVAVETHGELLEKGWIARR